MLRAKLLVEADGGDDDAVGGGEHAGMIAGDAAETHVVIVCRVIVLHVVHHMPVGDAVQQHGGGRQPRPQQRSAHAHDAHQQTDLQRQEKGVEAGDPGDTPRRNDDGRQDKDTRLRAPDPAKEAPQLRQHAPQQPRRLQRGDADADGVHEQHPVPHRGEARHPVLLRGWIVDPPVTPAKADDVSAPVVWRVHHHIVRVLLRLHEPWKNPTSVDSSFTPISTKAATARSIARGDHRYRRNSRTKYARRAMQSNAAPRG